MILKKMNSNVLFLSISFLVLLSCIEVREKADEKWRQLNDKAERLDSIIDYELDKVERLDSIVNKEIEKVNALDSIIENKTGRLDSLFN